ncbi:MAG: AAA family ATPase [Clostridiales bacterium]|nr:AAA family ATPase [Clostridiales bacterium]
MMQLKAYRITMYKCIIDSKWIEVSPLAVLVGKNESGKTSLLKALHKLNPFQSHPYKMAEEWTIGRRNQRYISQVIFEASIELNSENQLKLNP